MKVGPNCIGKAKGHSSVTKRGRVEIGSHWTARVGETFFPPFNFRPAKVPAQAELERGTPEYFIAGKLRVGWITVLSACAPAAWLPSRTRRPSHRLRIPDSRARERCVARRSDAGKASGGRRKEISA